MSRILLRVLVRSGVALSCVTGAAGPAFTAPGVEGAVTAETTLEALTVETQGGPRGVAPVYAGGQVARGGRLGLLGNGEANTSPFNVSSYTEAFIRDRQAATVSDALSLDSSVRATQSTGAPFDSVYIRGFPANEGTSGETAFDGIYGVAPSFRVFTDYAERIEVLKGPSAALSGVSPNGGVGGTINIVPKRASDDLTRITAEGASAGRGGSGFDIARRWGGSREWGARVVGSLHGGDTPFDRQSETTGVGALALDYQGERFRSWLYLVTQTDRFDAPLRPFLLKAGVPVPKAPPGGLNLTQPWEFSTIDDRGGLWRAEYDLADRLTLFADLGGSQTDVDRYFASAPTITSIRGDTLTTPQYYGLAIDRLTADAGIRAAFETGFIHHALVLQTSVYNEETGRWLSPSRGSYRSNVGAPILAAPITPTTNAARPRLSDSTLTGLSVADAMSALGDRIVLMVGARRQGIEAHNYTANVGTLAGTYDKTAVSPFAGLVLRPWDTVSLYANVIEGLSRGDIAPTAATNAGTILAPYVARQVEAGVKVDWGTLSTNLAVFRITKPSGELGPGRVYAQSGEQRIEGLELSVYGEPVPGLRLLGGLTLLDGTLTRTALTANLGHRPIGVPETQLNLGAELDVPAIPGLTLDGAVIHTGRQFIDVANRQALPDWTRLDLGARYSTLVGGRRTVFRASVLNATGIRYWSGVASYGTFFQGAPRTALLSMTVDL